MNMIYPFFPNGASLLWRYSFCLNTLFPLSLQDWDSAGANFWLTHWIEILLAVAVADIPVSAGVCVCVCLCLLVCARVRGCDCI